MERMGRKLASEGFGTFSMVFAGTGAIIVNDACGGLVTHVGIALTFGLIVMAMIYTLGDVSGCHLNPAVTIGFLAAGRFELGHLGPYILAQSFGALAASIALRLMFPTHPTLGATLPSETAGQSWVMEFLLTLMLMVVVLGVSSGGKEKGLMAGVAVGATVALEALFAGPVSGASMNPARSFAPAAVALHFDYLWVYLSAPIFGALAGVVVSRIICGQNRDRPLQLENHNSREARVNDET